MNALAIVVAILATLLAVWAWLRPGSTAAIVDATGRPLPGSVATLELVQLGAVQHALLIRGADVADSVLLYLHGGPGFGDCSAQVNTAGRTGSMSSGPLRKHALDVAEDRRD